MTTMGSSMVSMRRSSSSVAELLVTRRTTPLVIQWTGVPARSAPRATPSARARRPGGSSVSVGYHCRFRLRPPSVIQLAILPYRMSPSDVPAAMAHGPLVLTYNGWLRKSCILGFRDPGGVGREAPVSIYGADRILQVVCVIAGN